MSEKPLLIFDGDCGFCTSTANFILRNSSTALEAKPFQFIDVTAHGLTVKQTEEKVYFIVEGKNYSGHEAFAMLFQIQQNVLLKFFGKLLLVPPFVWLAKPGYSLVAKYRHKLPGGTPACKL